MFYSQYFVDWDFNTNILLDSLNEYGKIYYMRLIRLFYILIPALFLCINVHSAVQPNYPVAFSTIVYDNLDNPSVPIPDGWRRYVDLPSILQVRGYNAESFIHYNNSKGKKYYRIIIANRGTTLSIFDYYQDYLIFQENVPSYFNDANQFLNMVIKKMISDGIYQSATIEITGHSLGALISELIFSKIPPEHRWPSHVYDSPGAKNIIIKMSLSGDLPNNALVVTEQGIYHEFSAPNAINTINEQVSNPKTDATNDLVISFPAEDLSMIDTNIMHVPNYYYFFKNFSLNQHRINNFYDFHYKDNTIKSFHGNFSSDWPIGIVNAYKFYLSGNINLFYLVDYWTNYIQYFWDNNPLLQEEYHNNYEQYYSKFTSLLNDAASVLFQNQLSNRPTQSSKFNILETDLKNRNLTKDIKSDNGIIEILRKNINNRADVVMDIYNSASVDRKLYYTVLLNDMTQADKLLKEGNANPNSVHGDKKYSLLQIAIILGYQDMVRLLLKYHANPNYQNIDGDTALHIVAHERYGDSADYAKILVEGGVNTNIKNYDSMTALMIMKKNCSSCVKTFSNYAPV